MPNKFIKYLLSVVSAIYFVLAGTGYNVIQYCCDDCATEGIEFVVQHSCAAVHHEKEHDCFDVDIDPVLVANHLSHFQTCTHNDGCQIIRVQLDDFSIADHIVNPTSAVNDLFVTDSNQIYFSGYLTSLLLLHNYSPPLDLLVLRGREILSNKSVLVI